MPESASESAGFSETLKIQYLDLGSIPVVSTIATRRGPCVHEVHLWEDPLWPSRIIEGPRDPLLLSDEMKELDPRPRY